ncbi:response regulator transcription factor [Clostridium drakei]|uniref:Stage 0 sporulation protein A homolog n=1 Tax=Clostridium drakei TaxID=332101 RepID=A0A2U8DMK3_9CLOT|nr:response regulator transcription factor [Clostridium drakei]AWI03424.1 DNA-binding response regulator [Clostridium drakei]
MEYNYYKNKKILIVDDEPDLLELVSSTLKEDGYLNVDIASTVKEARKKLKDNPPDAAVLDVMLPDGNGFDLCNEIMKVRDIPILFLTARGEAEDRFQGLGMGADDYITKPFFPKELTLRLSAVLRRCYKEDDPMVLIESGEIDFTKAIVIKEGEEIPLTAKECAILDILYRNAGRIVTIDTLCQAVWGDNYFGYESALMAHIRRIREKIEMNPSSPVTLLTVKGLGYRLIMKEGR